MGRVEYENQTIQIDCNCEQIQTPLLSAEVLANGLLGNELVSVRFDAPTVSVP